MYCITAAAFSPAEGGTMTRKLYHQDSYQKEFSASVMDVKPEIHAVVLDQTAFYPGGGGQPPDKGFLEFNDLSLPVQKLKADQGAVLHYLPPDSPLPPISAAVNGLLDWPRRYQLMRTHTAMHILCGVIFRDYGASVTGGNMQPLQGRMDFEFTSLHKGLISEIERSINREVEASRSVSWRVLPREEAFQIPDLIRTKINLLPPRIKQVRVVEIDGLDLQADGGTHVRNTSEVGEIMITDYKSKGKDNKRIYLELLP
jgi:misacylated tRNA(Ala) deacylase